ncbi:FAD-dependent oxidoreductase [Nocardioides sp. SYSU DS0651]|uniref:FAD-dependent oxidoreductase n=1 Tax=Nocardioides sp. SYSU DS0651 TaxID=3415955 RepID=UPI003F4C7DA9
MTARLRVAVVGAGPAGAYAVSRLLAAASVEVEVFDRLPTPGGLVRAGVAPDHAHTKQVERTFQWWLSQPGVRLHLGVDIGRDVTAEDLAAHHHAVIYTTGASSARTLGLPGEELAGCHTATDLVGWYNGHPDHAGRHFPFDTQRAVVIGNGNVALDVARVLTLGATQLRTTDIADHALEALATSSIEEVVVLGRRGPAEAAFTTPELLGLSQIEGVDVEVSTPAPLESYTLPPGLSPAASYAAARKLELMRTIAGRPARGSRRIVLRFLASPLALEGDGRVERLRIVKNEPTADGGTRSTGEEQIIPTGLVLQSVGYRGRPVDGLPFDAESGRIPHQRGRVVDERGPVPGLYVAGWIKRGASGVIGTNKACAEETVRALLDDATAGTLPTTVGSATDLDDLLARRASGRIDLNGWRAIDRDERTRGLAQDRPRVKVCSIDGLRTLAATGG